MKVTVCVCVSVCLLSIGGHTLGPTMLKFGMESHIYPWEVKGYISFRYPNWQGNWVLGSVQPKWCISGKIS